MYQVSLIIDTDILDAYAQAAKDAPKTVRLFVDQTIRRDVGNKLIEDLRTEPGQPRYPLRWKSEKQRRYVMAKLRRENNLPYRRTHQLVNAWKVEHETFANGGLLAAVNPSPVGRFVFGGDQQPFHYDTGWYKADDVVLRHSERANDLLIEGWFSITDPGRGVKLV